MYARDDLAAMLWPDDPVDESRERFRQTLSQLKRTVEVPGVQSLIEADRQSVWLQSEIATSDANEFERLLKRSSTDSGDSQTDLEAALRLFSGPLLSGWSEEWVIPERDNFSTKRVQVARRLADIYVSQNRMDDALNLAQDAVRDDRLSEGAIQFLLSILMRAGRPAEAAKRFKEFRDLLRDQLDLEPSPATAKLLEESIEPRESTIQEVPATEDLEEHSADLGSSVPIPLTPIVGREKEVEQALTMLADPHRRMVTLTGPGGIGKTRLQLEIGRLIADQGERRAIFVSLSEIYSAHDLEPAIRMAMGLPDGHPNPAEQIRQALTLVPTVLLLDNLEQIAENVGDKIRRLLEDVPTLVVVGSSRVLMLIPGEFELPVGPLETPSGKPELDPLKSPGVALLVSRIRDRLPTFQVDSDQIDALIGLAQFLEGYPLALEIAAARVGLMTPVALLKQLQSRLSLVETRRRDISNRHMSMRAAIEWSYDNLEPETQRVFRLLSIFSGGAGIDAVIAVTEDTFALDRLEELRSQSLIRIEREGNYSRVRLLEVLREYALDKQEPEESERGRELHLAYFSKVAKEAYLNLNGVKQAIGYLTVRRETENSRSLVNWVVQSRHDLVTPALDMMNNISPYWITGGMRREARQLLERLLSLHKNQDSIRVYAHHNIGRVAALTDDWEGAKKHLNEGIELARKLGDLTALGDCLATLYVGHFDWGEVEIAKQLALEGLAVRRELGDPGRLIRTLEWLITIYFMEGNIEEGLRCGDESLALTKALNDPWATAHTMVHISNNLITIGRVEEAEMYAHQIRELSEQFEENLSRTMGLELLCQIYETKGDLLGAMEKAREAMNLQLQYQDTRHGLRIRRTLRDLCMRLGKWEEALKYQTEALNLLVREGPYSLLPQEISKTAEIVFRLGEPSIAGSILGVRMRVVEALDIPLKEEENPWIVEASEAAAERWLAAVEMGKKWSLSLLMTRLDGVLARRS